MLFVKSCLPPPHNYLEIDGIVPQIRKKMNWLLNGISTADFQINISFFFSSSSPLFHYEIASVSCCVCFSYIFFFFLFILSFFVCVCVCVCLILTCICIFKIFNVNSVSSQDEPFRLLE